MRAICEENKRWRQKRLAILSLEHHLSKAKLSFCSLLSYDVTSNDFNQEFPNFDWYEWYIYDNCVWGKGMEYNPTIRGREEIHVFMVRTKAYPLKADLVNLCPSIDVSRVHSKPIIRIWVNQIVYCELYKPTIIEQINVLWSGLHCLLMYEQTFVFGDRRAQDPKQKMHLTAEEERYLC